MNRAASRAAALALAIAFGAMPAVSAAAQSPGGQAPVAPLRLDLSGPWRLEASPLVAAGGEAISKPGFAADSWHPVRVPTTVLSALVERGVYPDPRVGLDAYRIPDSSDEFNAEHGLSKGSHLPGRENPWRVPWWYRREFELPPWGPAERIWLQFDAINYRAEVWLNGARVASPNDMVGMFLRHRIDVTRAARPGANALAVKIHPVDHPGVPETQWEVLGRDRGYRWKDIQRDVTEVMTIGYDCMMTVPDRNMGIVEPVRVEITGPVDIRDPFVAPDLELPGRARAALRISAELRNGGPRPVAGRLGGRIEGTSVRFERAFALGPFERREVAIDPAPVLERPRLWWPRPYGEQHLYALELECDAEGALSDRERVSFGVRRIGSELHEADGAHGRRVLVNGERIFCRGGYIQPELLLDWDARRREAEIRYLAEAHMNLIYFEDIPNPPEPFLDLCDRHGILFGSCAYGCYWLTPDSPYPDDFDLLERSTADFVRRSRNHPSLLFYMAMNEGDTKREVYEMWRRLVRSLDGTRWWIPSGTFPSDRRDVPDWFLEDLPAGMTDAGASYSWAEPEEYFRWVRENRRWMFMMEGGSPSVPPMSSLARFLPEALDPPRERNERWPLDRDWAHHGANHYFRGYDDALRRLHGAPETVAEYCWKGHVAAADQHRSFFEAPAHRLWTLTSGATQWKLNSCEPSVQWQLYDWYLKPMPSWHYARKACEPLHVQLDRLDRTVGATNLRLEPARDVEVRARAVDLGGRRLWEQATRADLAANSYAELFRVPEIPEATPVYFVRLELRDAGGALLSENTYWLRARWVEDYRALDALPLVRLAARASFEARGPEVVARVAVENPGPAVAFFVQLALTDGPGGPEILPVLWDDNYCILLPGESRSLSATFAAGAATGSPTLEVGGWNVEAPFRAEALEVSPSEARAGETVRVAAEISETFLDGSRVPLYLDGRLEGSRWAWARGGRRDRVAFEVRIARPGVHRLRVGEKTAEVVVR